jgi:YggT family protein
MIRLLIDIYIMMIIVDAILSYIPQTKEYKFTQYLRMITEFPQKPIRKQLPAGLAIDPSPLIVIIVLRLFVALW